MSQKRLLKNTSLTAKATKPELYYPLVLTSFEVIPRVSSPYSSWMNMGAILEINYISGDIDQAIEILDYANNYFIEQSIEIESAQARRALDFIDLRAIDIERELEQKKDRLKDFRTINKTVDVDLEIQSIISSLNELDAKLNEIEIEIEKAREVTTQKQIQFFKSPGPKTNNSRSKRPNRR